MKHIKSYTEHLNESTDYTHTLTPEQLEWCNRYLKSFSVNKSGEVSTDGDVDIDVQMTHIPVQFKTVKGDFSCFKCENLTSLKGAPQEVGRDFNCSRCWKLTSLEGAPQKVGTGFYCSNCYKLTSLKGAPKQLSEDFFCHNCQSLTSLEGAPESVGSFDCSECNSLTSLKGAPQEVGRYFDCSKCGSLTSLEGAPREVGGYFDCSRCKKLYSLRGISTFKDLNCRKTLVPEKELEVVNDPTLKRLWTQSGLEIDEFLDKYRGASATKRFGF